MAPEGAGEKGCPGRSAATLACAGPRASTRIASGLDLKHAPVSEINQRVPTFGWKKAADSPFSCPYPAQITYAHEANATCHPPFPILRRLSLCGT